MGMPGPFCKSSLNNTYPPNPDPIKFKVLKETHCNNVSILLVKYEGCTTFKGKKLLLLNKLWKGDIELDPHLLGDDHNVIARFEPNTQGFELAKMCAKNVK